MSDEQEFTELTQETSKEFSSMVQDLMEHLVAGRYEKLNIFSPYSPDPAQDFKDAIDWYARTVGKTLKPPQPEAYQLLEGFMVYEGPKSKRVVFISFPLWFDDEPSDFCAQIELEELEDGRWACSVNDVLTP